MQGKEGRIERMNDRREKKIKGNVAKRKGRNKCGERKKKGIRERTIMGAVRLLQNCRHRNYICCSVDCYFAIIDHMAKRSECI